MKEGKTVTVRDIDITVHIPSEVIQTGKWYWRYGYYDGGKEKFGRTREFEIPETAFAFPFISGNEVIKRIPDHRPRLTFSPELVEKIRTNTNGRYDNITKRWSKKLR